MPKKHSAVDYLAADLAKRLGCDINVHREVEFVPAIERHVVKRYDLVFKRDLSGTDGLAASFKMRLHFTSAHHTKAFLAGLSDLLTQGFVSNPTLKLEKTDADVHL